MKIEVVDYLGRAHELEVSDSVPSRRVLVEIWYNGLPATCVPDPTGITQGMRVPPGEINSITVHPSAGDPRRYDRDRLDALLKKIRPLDRYRFNGYSIPLGEDAASEVLRETGDHNPAVPTEVRPLHSEDWEDQKDEQKQFWDDIEGDSPQDNNPDMDNVTVTANYNGVEFTITCNVLKLKDRLKAVKAAIDSTGGLY